MTSHCINCDAELEIPRSRASENWFFCEECHERHCWPEPGDPATYFVGNRYPYEVSRVSASGSTIWVVNKSPGRDTAEQRCFWYPKAEAWLFCGVRSGIQNGFVLCGVR